MKMRCMLALAFLAISSIGNTAVIDFDSLATGPADPLTISGFTFATPPSGWVSQIVEEVPGDNALTASAVGFFDDFGNAGPLFISMSATSGDPFAFFGADISGTSAVGASVAFGISGVKSGGGYAAGPIGSADWLSLSSVQFGVSSCCGIGLEALSVTIDNVNASVVPLPAAFWLFGSAVAGLGWLRRKRVG